MLSFCSCSLWWLSGTLCLCLPACLSVRHFCPLASLSKVWRQKQAQNLGSLLPISYSVKDHLGVAEDCLEFWGSAGTAPHHHIQKLYLIKLPKSFSHLLHLCISFFAPKCPNNIISSLLQFQSVDLFSS